MNQAWDNNIQQRPMHYQQQNDNSMPTLYVGDLDEDITEQQLQDFFSQFGQVTQAKIMRDTQTKKSRGFGFVTFQNENDGDTAIKNGDGQVILHRPIKISWKIDPDAKLYIKNLDPTVTVQTLEKVFGAYGKIISSTVFTDETGNPKGSGFVHYESRDAAKKCLTNANNLQINGQQLMVRPFKSKARMQQQQMKRGFGGGRGGFGGGRGGFGGGRGGFGGGDFQPNNFDGQRKPFNPGFKKPFQKRDFNDQGPGGRGGFDRGGMDRGGMDRGMGLKQPGKF